MDTPTRPEAMPKDSDSDKFLVVVAFEPELPHPDADARIRVAPHARMFLDDSPENTGSAVVWNPEDPEHWIILGNIGHGIDPTKTWSCAELLTETYAADDPRWSTSAEFSARATS